RERRVRFYVWSSWLPLKLFSAAILSSHPLHKTIHHALLAGAVELNGQLVAVDRGDVAVAEFLMKDAVAEGKRRHRAGRFGDQLAFDGERHALGLLAAQRWIAPQRGEMMQRLVLVHLKA